MTLTQFRPGSQASRANRKTKLHAPIAAVTNQFDELRDACEAYPSDFWQPAQLGTDDFIMARGNTGGAGWIEISKSPWFADTETLLTIAQRMKMPLRATLMVSVSHRSAGQQICGIEILSDDAAAGREPLPTPQPIAIADASQTTTTITINFVTAPDVPLRVGQVVSIYGFVDTRLNVNSATVASVPSPTQITVVGNDYTFTSTTIGSTPGGGTAFIERADLLGLALNGVSVVHGNGTVTNRRAYVRSQGGLARPSGTLAGSHNITTGTDAATAAATGYNADAWLAPLETIIDVTKRGVVISDRAPDANGALTVRHRATQIVPNPDRNYMLQFRVRSTPSFTRAVAKITSIVKAGSTTATITTNQPHGLTTGQYVGFYGVRDQTNFANQTTGLVCTVTGPNTFTVVHGSSATATSWGGFVMRVQGQQPLGGAIAQVVQSIARTNNVLTVVGNATWAAPTAIGNIVELAGARVETTGADLGVDGSYIVASIATSTLTLIPVTDHAPTGADIPNTNCGGGVIQRMAFRIHCVMAEPYDPLLMEYAAKGNADAGDAFPVQVANTPAVSMTSTTISGNTAVDAAMPNPVAIGGRASNANIAAMSAAGDLVAQLMTMIGASIVKPYALPEAEWTYSNVLTTTSDVVAQTAAGAGIRRHLVWVGATNTGGTAVDLIIKDGANTRLQITIPGGGFVQFELPTGILSTANTALNVALSAAGTVRVNLLGYTAP